MKVDLDVRNMLEKELDGRTDSEMRVILPVLVCLRNVLREENERE